MMEKLKAIKPIQSIRETVYEQIKAAVLAGDFEPGERLLEHDIAKAMHVSRTPVRETLKRLEAEGLLEALPRQGLVIKQHTDNDIREIYIIRETLECLAAEFAAINATKSEINLLESYVADMDRLDEKTDTSEVMAVHRCFSDTYNRASHMPTLVRLIESLKEQITRFRSVSLSGGERRAKAHEEHKELLEALKRRDPERASALTREHVRNALTACFDSKSTGETDLSATLEPAGEDAGAKA